MCGRCPGKRHFDISAAWENPNFASQQKLVCHVGSASKCEVALSRSDVRFSLDSDQIVEVAPLLENTKADLAAVADYGVGRPE